MKIFLFQVMPKESLYKQTFKRFKKNYTRNMETKDEFVIDISLHNNVNCIYV